MHYFNAFDIALQYNQIAAVSTMLDYVVSYQNNFCSAELFRDNLDSIMSMNISIQKLFESKVFYLDLEFDNWPTTHNVVADETMIIPYNGAIFELRDKYDELFGADFPQSDAVKKGSDDKRYSVRYRLNLLPSLRFDQTKFLDSCIERGSGDGDGAEELSIFQSKTLKTLIKFKWESHGAFLFRLGLVMHLVYMAVLTTYIYLTYLSGVYGETPSKYFPLLLFIGIAYPALYDLIQMHNEGWDYW